METIIKLFVFLFVFFLYSTTQAKPTIGYSVEVQILDKITARISTLDILVGSNLKYASLNITIHHCQKRPPEEIPEDFVLIEIKDEISPNNYLSVFNGWMLSSSSTIVPFEHPTYDVWVTDCKIYK